MGVLDKFLDAIKLNDDYDDDELLDDSILEDEDDYDDDDFLDDDDDMEEKPKKKFFEKFSKKKNVEEEDDFLDDEPEEEPMKVSAPKVSAKIPVSTKSRLCCLLIFLLPSDFKTQCAPCGAFLLHSMYFSMQ